MGQAHRAVGRNNVVERPTGVERQQPDDGMHDVFYGQKVLDEALQRVSGVPQDLDAIPEPEAVVWRHDVPFCELRASLPKLKSPAQVGAMWAGL